MNSPRQRMRRTTSNPFSRRQAATGSRGTPVPLFPPLHWTGRLDAAIRRWNVCPVSCTACFGRLRCSVRTKLDAGLCQYSQVRWQLEYGAASSWQEGKLEFSGRNVKIKRSRSTNMLQQVGFRSKPYTNMDLFHMWSARPEKWTTPKLMFLFFSISGAVMHCCLTYLSCPNRCISRLSSLKKQIPCINILQILMI